MNVRENLRPFSRPLLFVGLSLVPIALYVMRGPTYMQYFAMFWLGAVTALVIAAAIGQLRPPRAAHSKTAK